MYRNDRYLKRRPAAVYESCAAAAENAGDQTTGAQSGPVYAMAYVRSQVWGEIYPDQDALSCGTLFPVLDLPYEGGRRR